MTSTNGTGSSAQSGEVPPTRDRGGQQPQMQRRARLPNTTWLSARRSSQPSTIMGDQRGTQQRAIGPAPRRSDPGSP